MRQSATHCWLSHGAGEMNRTPDLLITNELLYRLSYTGASTNYISTRWPALTRSTDFGWHGRFQAKLCLLGAQVSYKADCLHLALQTIAF